MRPRSLSDRRASPESHRAKASPAPPSSGLRDSFLAASAASSNRDNPVATFATLSSSFGVVVSLTDRFLPDPKRRIKPAGASVHEAQEKIVLRLQVRRSASRPE